MTLERWRRRRRRFSYSHCQSQVVSLLATQRPRLSMPRLPVEALEAIEQMP